MDFKDILTQLDTLKGKGDEKKPVVEKKTKRPSNMLTESEVVTGVKLPSLSGIFEELSLEPMQTGTQEIHKDGEAIGTVSNPQLATQMKSAMDGGELTIGEEEISEAEDWIAGAVKKPGAFTAQAKRAGMSTQAFARHVLANKDEFTATTEKRANLAKTFSKMKETDTPPESSLDLTSPISGGNMREGANMAAQYGPDDGSHNSSNDEKGNAAANAALASNDADTPQLVNEKDYDVKPTKNPKAVKGKVLNPKGKTTGQASPETYVESKSRKLPTISRIKAMCNEGLSTQDIQQLHPKCNKKELNIMITNTKTNLKEGADHILSAAKHMGHAHGLCKGSYACPHDEGSEGHRAYHEGYKTGLDECMGIRNEPIIGLDELEVDEGIAGALVGAGAGAGIGAAGARAGTALGTLGSIGGGAIGATLGSQTQDAVKRHDTDEGEIVDDMASYGAMGEAESSPDGNVGADDDGAYDQYDWDAGTVARKGIDETSTLDEDEWTFESFDKELQSHLTEGKEATKQKLEEGYTMSITQGEENIPDRVSVNATDAEADKLIKFVKDVGLGQYGDAEVVDVVDGEPDVADVSFYGSDAPETQELGSHDDMLKLMGIVDMADGDFEDEVEAPGTVSDVDVQVDSEEEMCEGCGSKITAEGCGCVTNEHQGYNDKEDESLGMRDGKDSHKDDDDASRRDQSRGDFGHRHGGEVHEEQGYDDKEDESLGMRTGKESSKKQSDKARRDDSYGQFGKRDEEHRDIKEQEKDAGLDDKYDWDASTTARKGIDEESDVERDDHAERAGKEVAHDAHYDGRRHSGKDGEDVVKDLEYDDWKDKHRTDEEQGYDDKEDESLGMRTGDESDKKQSMKDRRDDSYGQFGKRDKEHRHVSLEETLRTLDLLAEVGAETSEEPTQPLSQHDDDNLTTESAEDNPADNLDGSVEPVTETQTDDQREFTVAEEEVDEGKIPAGLKAYQDKKKGKKDDDKDVKEEKLDEWANDAGKNGTETTFEQDIDFMTKVISGGLNKQKSTGQTTIPVIAGQEDRMGYNGADLVKEGSVMTHDGLAGLMTKLDSLK